MLDGELADPQAAFLAPETLPSWIWYLVNLVSAVFLDLWVLVPAKIQNKPQEELTELLIYLHHYHNLPQLFGGNHKLSQTS